MLVLSKHQKNLVKFVLLVVIAHSLVWRQLLNVPSVITQMRDKQVVKCAELVMNAKLLALVRQII